MNHLIQELYFKKLYEVNHHITMVAKTVIMGLEAEEERFIIKLRLKCVVNTKYKLGFPYVCCKYHWLIKKLFEACNRVE